MGRLRVLLGFVLLSQVSLPAEPTVRIGIERNVEGFTLSSSAPFVIEGISTRRAEFLIVIALAQGEGPFNRDDLETRIGVETDDERVFWKRVSGSKPTTRAYSGLWTPRLRFVSNPVTHPSESTVVPIAVVLRFGALLASR